MFWYTTRVPGLCSDLRPQAPLAGSLRHRLPHVLYAGTGTGSACPHRSLGRCKVLQLSFTAASSSRAESRADEGGRRRSIADRRGQDGGMKYRPTSWEWRRAAATAAAAEVRTNPLWKQLAKASSAQKKSSAANRCSWLWFLGRRW